MPNHITNILKISGEEAKVKECLEKISSTRTNEEDGSTFNMIIDFNEIVPRPKSLDITSGSSVDNAVALLRQDNGYFEKMLDYPWVKKEGFTTIEQVKGYLRGNLSEKDLEEGRLAIENEAKYGCRDWYSWSIKFWGTKWNAYDQIVVEFGTIQFDTAWSTPYPVMAKLAQKFPDLEFEVKFADEDLGSNCGIYSFMNGMLHGEYQPEGPEAYKFACEVKGYDFENNIIDNFEYWELDTISDYEDTIAEMLKDGDATEFLDRIDLESKEGKAKAEFIKELAVKHEMYEVASAINTILENR